MDNKQIPNVFATGGGYRCRHQWSIAIAGLRAQQKGKTAAGSKPRKVTRENVDREVSARRAINAIEVQNRLGVPHPHVQIAEIRAKAEQTIRARRANV